MLNLLAPCFEFYYFFLDCSALQLAITVIFQLVIMRDLEKLAGSLRISIIYMASGVAGCLSSAIFLPYHVEVPFVLPTFSLLLVFAILTLWLWLADKLAYKT